ncbi:uncharacterized protein SPSC_05825 [Sporisorium scitamineum]|uniref:Uncharacterized protein n=1 Tax=Sporisorium scitamineum TaxID=49012 RepID=A0A0F7S5B5_9BASI|nr:uncharacterized protein SPSC_05825 [Sporisorium scitamineum]CDW95882.1 hypothetical protein [Sporisorium scitamineum]
MPAVRTTPRDVLIRVPKVEPYSNSYLPPSARAKEEAKKLAAGATIDASTNATAEAGIAPATGAHVAAATTQVPTASTSNPAAPLPSTTSNADPAPTTTTAAAADAAKPDADAEEASQRQRGNSPTLPFLDVDRHEDQTVELSKAATSSAGWNSLLVWARRQRGAQWDASTALWQVDKYSREYYSFAQDPATTDRAKQPGDEAEVAAGGGDEKQVVGEEDEDKGPTRVSRNREDVSGANTSPPPVAVGRSVRLLRR